MTLASIFVLLLTSPFHALLAEKLRRPSPSRCLLSTALQLYLGAGVLPEIRKVLYYLPIALGVLLITAIINAVAPLPGFAGAG